MEVLLALAGIVVGFGLSVLFWWYLNHAVVPEIEWGEAISKRVDPSTRHAAYRLKIRNCGRRDILDLSCSATVFHPSMSLMVPPIKTTVQIVTVPLKTNRLFVLRSKKNRILRLDLASCGDLGSASKAAAEEIRSGRDGSLEALFGLHPESYMRLQILAYDSFSGARQFYESPKYTAAEVIFGVFDGLAVKPAESNP